MRLSALFVEQPWQRCGPGRRMVGVDVDGQVADDGNPHRGMSLETEGQD